VEALGRKVRSDSGKQFAIHHNLAQVLQAQYRQHTQWSYQLHVDNLAVRVQQHPELGTMPSYSTILRYMKQQGLLRKPKVQPRNLFGGKQRAAERLENREVRSFESTHTYGLWHLDFHTGSLKVLTSRGQWATPHLLAVLDDHSRLVCHAQWYLGETASDLVHGLNQAFLKRGLPRALMTDLGSALMANETRQGLLRLDIHHETTLPYSPYQNGKQEVFWAQVEGRLLAMLDNYPDLTLEFLNEATQAWVEMEYQRALHSEIGCSPLQRFLQAPSVGRDCPTSEELRQAFCQQTTRSHRRSDGTISLSGIRLEIPSRYRHLPRITVRYADWDLSHVYLVDPHTHKILCSLYPLNKAQNADARRRRLPAVASTTTDAPSPLSEETVAPLLRKLLQEYAATGLPPAYLPKNLSQEES
jgi:transposase InsO family protein